MGTILSDFFYQSKYQDRFDRTVNNYIFNNVGNLEIVSDLLYIEEYFSGIVSNLIDFIQLRNKSEGRVHRINHLVKQQERLEEEIKVLNSTDESITNSVITSSLIDGLFGIVADGKKERVNAYLSNREKINDLKVDKAVDDHRLGVTSDKIIKLYEKINVVYTKLQAADVRIKISYLDLFILKATLSEYINDEDAVNYIANEIYSTIIDELDYLLEVFRAVRMISGDVITPEDLIKLKNKKLVLDNIKEVLVIKKELIAASFYKMYKGKTPKNITRIDEERNLIDSASQYLDLMICGRDSKIYDGVMKIIQTTKWSQGDSETKKINYRLNKVYKSHVGNIKVIK